jgi:hypothetical protein
MRLFFFFALSLALWVACNSPSGEKSDTSATTSPPAAPAQPATLPSVPIETLQFLVDSCDNVDYLFYELPISMSLDNKPSIINALSHVASEPAPIPANCKSIGRIFFVVKGRNEAMAEMYFSPGCTFFVFLKDEKPAYSNYMTPEAVQYFNNVFAQAGIKAEQLNQ